MVSRDHRTQARYLFFAALTSALLSQPGHLLAYLVRFGPRALNLQAGGVHSYFPGVLGGSLAMVGAGALGALLLLAAGRFAYRRALNLKAVVGVSVAWLLPLMLAVQLNVYLVQEMLEAAASRRPLTAAALGAMVAWGLVGQLPIAIVASLALAWLSRPLITALRALRSPFAFAALPGFQPWPAPLAAPVLTHESLRRQLLAAARAPRRGPPPPR